jgi:hypothetical protein
MVKVTFFNADMMLYDVSVHPNERANTQETDSTKGRVNFSELQSSSNEHNDAVESRLVKYLN